MIVKSTSHVVVGEALPFLCTEVSVLQISAHCTNNKSALDFQANQASVSLSPLTPMGIDAVAQTWPRACLHAFLPFKLFPLGLLRMWEDRDRHHLLLVALQWLSRVGFLDLVSSFGRSRLEPNCYLRLGCCMASSAENVKSWILIWIFFGLYLGTVWWINGWWSASSHLGAVASVTDAAPCSLFKEPWFHS